MRWLGSYIHGALLILALGATYYSWKYAGQNEVGPEDTARVAVWKESSPVTEISYKEGNRNVVVSKAKKQDGLPDIFVTKTVPEPKNAKAANVNNQQQKVKPGEKTPSRNTKATGKQENIEKKSEKKISSHFKGNKKALELLAGFSSLKAKRALGKPESEQLISLGLDPPTGNMEVRFKSKTRKIRVGKPTYGTAGRYIMLEDTGEVFVADSDIVSSLKWAATRLKETDPFGPKLKDAESLQIAVGSKSKTLVRMKSVDQREKQKKKKGEKEEISRSNNWAFKESPGEESEEATNWVAKLFRLRARKYQGAMTDMPANGQDVLDINFNNGKTTGTRLHLYKIKPDINDESKNNKPTTGESKINNIKYFLSSPRLESLVQVSSNLAREIVRDAEALISKKAGAKPGKTKAKKNHL
ncbi:MAG: DUF4340 domain-containing protein [Deltaproteobacteria bacterium]|nr:DUF4340 domain-containing protein [Deltaproteobacteria bacterium]